jgi:preprotein translocase subunit SecE
MGSEKFTHLLFAFAGLLLVVVLSKSVDWVWGAFGRPNDLVVTASGLIVGGAATFVAWRNERAFSYLSEVAAELKKVSWPSKKETYTATMVVIITVLVASAILGVFDAFWSWATGKLIAG